MENEQKLNVITSEVEVVGLKRISFEDKDKKLVEGIKVFYTLDIKENDYNKHDIKGRQIDPNNYSCFVKDMEKWDEFISQELPYMARLEQEYVATNKPLRFIDIKVIY